MSAFLLLVAGAPCLARAAEAEEPDSLRRRQTSFVALPYAYYTPETKFAFGGGGVYSFRSADCSPDERPSNVRVALTYTQLHQIIIAAKPEVYLRNERYFFGGFYGFYKYPSTFWGIGNDTPDAAEESYESYDFESQTIVQKRVRPGIYFGVRYEYRNLRVRKTSPGGFLGAGIIPGCRGGEASGAGIIITHDTRDNIYRPSAGFYNQCHAVFFGNGFGSDYTFTELRIDLRTYRRVRGSHVLAFQTYDTFITGEPPFQMLSLLGGAYMMRGYYFGRFRDKHMLTIQTEYRTPIWWRFGAAAFCAIGDVGSDIRDFRFDRLKYSLGCGLRFMFDAQEGINARLDVGVGRAGNAGVYAMVLEAF